ncbi:MAG TPA: tripartite tricarboxylate transporter substrate binding protein [Xanthobacteraceae bacterium]|jgi:tripartite-type tricarboxylate transporter receptor subunit TctC|nr:tripartite tricarboxylate transporter substrate binding protein [Xanthobacteraceae bacterium]
MKTVVTSGRGFRAYAVSFLAGSVLALAAAGSPAWSEDAYPSRVVRIIVPYGAGGIADVTMRMVAEQMSKKLGQTFIIENKPGAGGVIGMKAALSAPADGYTLSMIGGGLTIAKSLFKSLPYDLTSDLIPISTTASYGLVIATKAGSPLKTVKDVIAAAKAKPGSLNFGTINPGSTQHLSAELFKSMAGIEVTMVPYKTTPELATAVIRGDVDVAFEYYAGFQSPIENGQIAAIAATGPKRAAELPNVPTAIESGLPGYDVTSWNGLAAPVGTPANVVKILNAAVNDAVKAPEVQKISSQNGMTAEGSTVEDLQKRIKSDIAKWADVIQKAGIEKR